MPEQEVPKMNTLVGTEPKKSDVIGFVRKSEDMEGFNNNCGKTQVKRGDGSNVREKQGGVGSLKF